MNNLNFSPNDSRGYSGHPANDRSLDQFVHTIDLGFPAEKLLIQQSESLKNSKLVQFLIDLDKQEYTHLKNEEDLYGKANEDWKKITPLLWKITYIGLGVMFGSLILGSKAKSEFVTTLSCSSFFASSTCFIGGLLGITHFSRSTGFEEVAIARFNRLNEKVKTIQNRILQLNRNIILDKCPNNSIEIQQLNKALSYFNETLTQMSGHVITDDRLPFSTTLKIYKK